jgi:predicted SprT family Zn-dependent metalloprotease
MQAILEKQKLEAALLKAVHLMSKSGLSDWKININNKRSILAETWYRTKTIMFSKHFVMVATEDQFVGVTYHEIAHALVGKGHGHDEEFKKLCTEISPNAEYSRSSVNIGVSIRKFLLECPDCGYKGSTNSKKDRYCGVCWKNKKEAVLFNKTENTLKINNW